jgi:hypothetical protein
VRAPDSIEARVLAGSNEPEPGPSPRRRVAAGVVAFAVFIAAGAFAWRAFDDGSAQTIAGGPDLPTLAVRLQSAGFLPDTPPDEDPWLKVTTTIDYGDLQVVDDTSTTPDGIVDWVAVEDLTPLAPGPVVGSPVSVSSDGSDGRVSIGTPSDWPNFDRFQRIDTLPTRPGDYVVLFEADYPQGTAMTARSVHLVEPGTVQLTIRESSGRESATASAAIDGVLVEGFLATRSILGGDVGAESPPHSPSFAGVAPLRVVDGSPVVLSIPADEAAAGLFPPKEEIPDRLPIDLNGPAEIPATAAGTYHLAVDAAWTHGRTGYGQTGTEEHVRFLFPVEVVPADAEPTPAPVETPPATLAPAEPTATLLVSNSGASLDDALLEDSLQVHNGCVGAGDGEAFTYLIWPAGSRLVQEGDRLTVVDATGTTVASIGDTIRMGGGIDVLGRAQEVVVGAIPPACQETGVHYWYVGQIVGVTPAVPATPAPSVVVPDVVGLPFEDARARLQSLGLEVGHLQVVTGGYPVAVVVEQDPAPGTSVDGGTAVDLVTGPSPSG